MLLEDLKIILQVAKSGSITAAAEHLDMRTATASAAVKRVEQTLGFELFVRTTRSLRLSSAGEKYIPQCEQAIQMLELAKQGAKTEAGIVDGEIRMAISSDLGRNVVLPWLDDFMEHHPNVSLKLHLGDSYVDFYRDSTDIALRYGPPHDSTLYGFKICDVPLILCASPEYLQAQGTPEHPDELADHNGLFYQISDIVHHDWKLSDGTTEYKVRMKANRAANDGDVVRRWCVNGKGITTKCVLDIAHDLMAGKLVNFMPGYAPPSTELWLVCPSRQSITPAVHLLRKTIRQRCKDLYQELHDRQLVDLGHLL